MGSTFKSFTTAMALDSGKVTLESRFDASRPITIGHQTIHDFHGKGRVLTVPEVFIYSSNIGSAREADAVGVEGHREFLHRVGLLDRMQTELPEVARPTEPKVWKKINSITIAFGHGVSTTPLQTAVAAAALMNGGYLMPPTFLPRSQEEASAVAKRVVKEKTGDAMRYLYRLNAEKGSGKTRRGSGLPRRRQDRHGRKGRQRPLFQRQALQRLRRRLPDGRSAIHRAVDHRRAETREAGHGRDGGLECRADRRQHHPPLGVDAWRQTRFRPRK